jgi:RimJ/RimL family protein N-acetyltransferase
MQRESCRDFLQQKQSFIFTKSEKFETIGFKIGRDKETMKLQSLILTERLQLRPLGPEDTEELFRFASDPENARYMIYLPVHTKEGTRQFLEEAWEEWQKESPAYYEYGIVEKGNTAVIGEISLWVHEENAELGWILDKQKWNHGYMTEAARALMEVAAKQLDCRWFTAHCDDENRASYRVMEKLGMELQDRYGGRKNKGSEEERMERFYRMPVPGSVKKDLWEN